MVRRLMIIIACLAGCGNTTTGPCRDTAEIVEPGKGPAVCHAQASVSVAPIGSGNAVVVCRCNILPGESPTSCPLPPGWEAGDAGH